MRRRDWVMVMLILWGVTFIMKLPDLIEVLQDPCVCMPAHAKRLEWQ